MIDIRKLKELVRLMVANDLTEIDLRDSEEQVTLRRENDMPTIVSHGAAPPAAPVAVAPPPAVAPTGDSANGAPTPPVDDTAGMHRIESPMVGTFYSAPDPDSPAFVEIGQRVTTDTVVCLIEAMKIFNEIKAECVGTMHRVEVKNSAAVEFGQPLFFVKPD